MNMMMKMNKLVLGAILVATSFSVSYGQSDSKDWKKKLKELTPEQYKRLVDDNNNLQKQVSELRGEAEHYRSESQSKDAQIAKLLAEIKENESKTVASPAQVPATNSSSKTVQNISTIIYKVQIGAFRNKDLKKYLDNHPIFSGDSDSDGTRKYTLGAFTDYWEADRFKKYLREMGVKDAWIVAYKNGERIPIKDALESSL